MTGQLGARSSPALQKIIVFKKVLFVWFCPLAKNVVDTKPNSENDMGSWNLSSATMRRRRMRRYWEMFSWLYLSVSSPTVVLFLLCFVGEPKFKVSLFPCEGHQPLGPPPLGRVAFSISFTPPLHFRLCRSTPSARYPFPPSLPVEMWAFWNCSLWIPCICYQAEKQKGGGGKKRMETSHTRGTECKTQQAADKCSPPGMTCFNPGIFFYLSYFFPSASEATRVKGRKKVNIKKSWEWLIVH